MNMDATLQMSDMAPMLNGHIDIPFLHTCAPTHPIAIASSHFTAMYVPETNMPLKSHTGKLNSYPLR